LALPYAVCLADDASHRKAAEELLTVTNAENNLQEIAEQLIDSLLQQNPQLAPHRDVLQTFMTKYLGWESLKEDMITIYAKEFTEDELKELTAFYHTPVGKKAIEKLPQLVHTGAQLGITRIQANRAELLRILEEADGKSK
jgi:hypothetical protein